MNFDRYNTNHWKLDKSAKYNVQGAVRIVSPSVTIRRATKAMAAAGITMIADVTHLDRLGIPNFMAVRPDDLGPGISYYNGKGTTKADAHAGALMEAIERHAGERCDYEITKGSFSELSKTFHCVDPSDLSMPFLTEFSPDIVLEWVEGLDLINNERILVPLNCVICPYSPDDPSHRLFYATSNGLASGNSVTEAVCHAIFEVVERDAYALAVAEAELAPTVASLMGEGRPRPVPGYNQIRLESLPHRASLLIRKILRAGLKVYLRDFSAYSPIAVLDCTIVDAADAGKVAAHGGLGAHLDANVALLRAITEAAQSRIGMIQGGREDLTDLPDKSPAFNSDEVFGRGEMVDFSTIKSTKNAFIDDDLNDVLTKMPEFGLTELIAFDLTRPDVGIPVVRVVAPKAETWTVFHLHTGRGAFGQRASSLLKESVENLQQL